MMSGQMARDQDDRSGDGAGAWRMMDDRTVRDALARDLFPEVPALRKVAPLAAPAFLAGPFASIVASLGSCRLGGPVAGLPQMIQSFEVRERNPVVPPRPPRRPLGKVMPDGFWEDEAARSSRRPWRDRLALTYCDVGRREGMGKGSRDDIPADRYPQRLMWRRLIMLKGTEAGKPVRVLVEMHAMRIARSAVFRFGPRRGGYLDAAADIYSYLVEHTLQARYHPKNIRWYLIRSGWNALRAYLGRERAEQRRLDQLDTEPCDQESVREQIWMDHVGLVGPTAAVLLAEAKVSRLVTLMRGKAGAIARYRNAGHTRDEAIAHFGISGEYYDTVMRRAWARYQRLPD